MHFFKATKNYNRVGFIPREYIVLIVFYTSRSNSCELVSKFDTEESQGDGKFTSQRLWQKFDFLAVRRLLRDVSPRRHYNT